MLELEEARDCSAFMSVVPQLPVTFFPSLGPDPVNVYSPTAVSTSGFTIRASLRLIDIFQPCLIVFSKFFSMAAVLPPGHYSGPRGEGKRQQCRTRFSGEAYERLMCRALVRPRNQGRLATPLH
jgi:hypothetical protein